MNKDNYKVHNNPVYALFIAGILIAKKWMFKNHVPDRVGGGTVVFVSYYVSILV